MSLDLFTAPHSNYPFQASFKTSGTSEEAAARIESTGRAQVLRQRVLFALRRPSTAKEIAHALGEEITSIRPRFTELKAQLLIEETGDRRDHQNIYVAIA